MTFLYWHKKIRNDDHCPNCKQHYVSFHNNIDEAYNKFLLDTYEETVELDEQLMKSGYSLWIDEWVRRRNGDLYQIIKIIPDFKYNLKRELKIDNHQVSTVNYMVLYLKLDSTNDCPDNIKFYISFHTISDNLDKIISDMYKDLTLDDIHNMLTNFKPIWKNSSSIKGIKGKYYTIVDVTNNNTTINLNGLCEILSTNIVW